eukprot:1448554-Amphidinium_carterae.1
MNEAVSLSSAAAVRCHCIKVFVWFLCGFSVKQKPSSMAVSGIKVSVEQTFHCYWAFVCDMVAALASSLAECSQCALAAPQDNT